MEHSKHSTTALLVAHTLAAIPAAYKMAADQHYYFGYGATHREFAVSAHE